LPLRAALSTLRTAFGIAILASRKADCDFDEQQRTKKEKRDQEAAEAMLFNVTYNTLLQGIYIL